MPSFELQKSPEPHFKQGNEFVVQDDYYEEVAPFVRGKESRLLVDGKYVLSLQNGIGHCCGMTLLCRYDPSRFITYFNDIVEYLRPHVGKKMEYHLKWSLQDKVFLILSDETASWDSEIRKHPRMSLVYSFNNKATKPYSGSMCHLYVLDLA